MAAASVYTNPISQDFGIRTDHYVKINFNSFQDFVDALGGVDVIMDYPIACNFPREPGSKDLVYQTLQPGHYHMDGVFALRYVRERRSTSDVDRAAASNEFLLPCATGTRDQYNSPVASAL